ncbi:MAG: ribbon-helix-helix protein, CopG family, partial [Firmicutes bacterium]|nr:ribbon-helix-helix protein, CopG family [Bacillota bacterium]
MTIGMLIFHPEVPLMVKVKKISISLSEDLIAVLDGIRLRERSTRSGAIARLLRHWWVSFTLMF